MAEEKAIFEERIVEYPLTNGGISCDDTLTVVLRAMRSMLHHDENRQIVVIRISNIRIPYKRMETQRKKLRLKKITIVKAKLKEITRDFNFVWILYREVRSHGVVIENRVSLATRLKIFFDQT